MKYHNIFTIILLYTFNSQCLCYTQSSKSRRKMPTEIAMKESKLITSIETPTSKINLLMDAKTMIRSKRDIGGTVIHITKPKINSIRSNPTSQARKKPKGQDPSKSSLKIKKTIKISNK